MLGNIKVVLVQTSHPGNIGSAARAMKTMELSNLVLVNPKSFPDPKAEEMCSHATDVLNNATVVNSIEEAISDCHLVIGASTRNRSIPWPLVDPHECAKKLLTTATQGKAAILFGREQTGLSNEELQQCHYHVQIPANPEYSSLNLAAAVQVICYEIYSTFLKKETLDEKTWDFEPATMDEMNRFYAHLEETLIATEFLKPRAPRQLMTRLKRLFNRAELDTMEVSTLRGILSSIRKKLSSNAR
jgi:tRNA (cytidine32/uridine32-2'-O)-methyltransferase